MSVECSECERDLRGGHDIACSRYNLLIGVAEAMMRAVGMPTDEDGPSVGMLTAAQAAVTHVRDYDAARKHLEAE